MQNRKQIFLLIGPKGSGKSFIGTLFEHYFQIDFLRVEDYVKKVKGDRGIDDETYLKEVFEIMENAVRQSLNNSNSVVFESTGLTDHFDKMLKNLKTDFNVTTIKVNVSKELCLWRIKTRDQSIHINVSDDQVNFINSAVLTKNLNTDFEIENSNKSIEELNSEIKKILKITASQQS